MQAELATPLRVDALRAAVNGRLDALVPSRGNGRPRCVDDAIRYSLLAPGKRIRPLLTMFAAQEFGADALDALDVACATEMVHTASLVLDDLPAMDDARLRRGQQTAHVRFGESTAILAAVGLLNEAFATLARASRLTAETRIALVERISAAVGLDGLVTGQDNDLHDRASATATIARIERLNHQKTSVLFEASLELGALVAGAGERTIGDLRRVAAHLGLAYQIADDLFDGSAASGAPLKDINKDRGKPTVVSLLGVERARERFGHHMTHALQLLPGDAGGERPLRAFVAQIFSPALSC